jgi:ribosomal silencing factor RsfS
MSSLSAVRTTRCPACTCSVLRLFIGSITGTPVTSLSLLRPAAGSTPLRTGPSTAAFSTFSPFRPTRQLHVNPALTERVPDSETKDSDSTSPSSSSSSNDPTVPWYLQVEPPRHPTLLHEPAPLPEIPDGVPKLTEPLLKYVSDELGMDDLVLLDLRELEPAPALGPGLVMIIGTARSERHLHVSADRLVRWLRGRGISASADGLLGRNELKTKLRRLARKAKLLGSSSVVRTGGDDGISTGWVCVNLGLVGASHEEVLFLDEEGRPTGFGRPQTGNTIVVQMLTETRRKELDLEGLWKDKLQQSRSKVMSAEARVAAREAKAIEG